MMPHSPAGHRRMGVPTMNLLSPSARLPFACGLAVALLLAQALSRPRSARPRSTAGWTLADFFERLQQRGVRLRVVPEPREGGPRAFMYLTEDADVTWDSMQRKGKLIE